eukprot:447188_1
MALICIGKSALLFHLGLLNLCIYFHLVRTSVNEILTDKGLIEPAFGGNTRYLTVWGQYLTLFYVFTCCVNDIIHILDLSSKNTMMKVVQCIFYPICTITSIIGIAFWLICLVDPHALMSKEIEMYYPMVLNVFQHGGSAFILWIDVILCVKKIYSKQFHYFTTVMALLIYVMWS